MEERFYWLGFSAFSGVGPVKFQKLIQKFKTAENAWTASSIVLKEVIGEVLSLKFEKFKRKFSIENYIKKLNAKKVSFLTIGDKDYPKFLLKIPNPPFVLYVKGNISVLNSDKTIGIVGTRKITQYGEEITKMFTSELVQNNFTSVSGLAFGVDACAHNTTIENGGKTIAVLGNGVDLCFPSSNQAIYNSIASGSGCIVSQFPLGEAPSKGSFPSRNRIIAGLSKSVLVTEGSEDSGSLITADYAFKFNRKVFAVPGPITSNLSKGPFKLIQKGAKLVTSSEDILRELKISSDPEFVEGQKSKVKITSQNLKIKDLTKEERKIIGILQNENLTFDQILKKTKINPAKLGSILSMMEIKGTIKYTANCLFSLEF